MGLADKGFVKADRVFIKIPPEPAAEGQRERVALNKRRVWLESPYNRMRQTKPVPSRGLKFLQEIRGVKHATMLADYGFTELCATSC